MAYHIYHNFTIKGSSADVYEAVSNPKHLINWWPQKCEGSAESGCVYNLFFTTEYDWFAKVVTAIPNKSFHLKMTKADQDWTPTTFGFDIVPSKNGVTLQFWHKDWPYLNDHFKHSSFCWALLLNALKNYVEKGEIIPFENRS